MATEQMSGAIEDSDRIPQTLALLDLPVATVDLLGHRGSSKAETSLSPVRPAGLDYQYIVGLLLDDLTGDPTLAAHGVDGHHRAGLLKCVEQLGNSRDLVGFFINFALRQHQAFALGPSRNHVDEGFLASLARPVQGLAFDGHFSRRGYMNLFLILPCKVESYAICQSLRYFSENIRAISEANQNYNRQVPCRHPGCRKAFS